MAGRGDHTDPVEEVDAAVTPLEGSPHVGEVSGQGAGVARVQS